MVTGKIRKESSMKKFIVYYTDNMLEEELHQAVQRQIIKAANGIPIISVSQVPMDFGRNICVGRKPASYISLHEQLLTGVKAADKGSVVYLCEHDVFYHPTYFEFMPPEDYAIYFNLNRFFWKRNLKSFLKTNGYRAYSQGVAYREMFIKLAKEQLHNRRNNLASPVVGQFLNFETLIANVDIRHGSNFSGSNPQKESYAAGESPGLPMIPYWGTAESLQERVGYYDLKVGTKKKLHDRFNPESSETEVTIPKFYRRELNELFKELGFKKGAEIGVKAGTNAIYLCSVNPDLHLTCVDDWIPRDGIPWDFIEIEFGKCVARLKDYPIEVIRKNSVQAAAGIPNWSFDFVHIDAGHDFDSVMQDILLWVNKVRPGGIVSGHDYGDLYPDVKCAVDAYVKSHEIELFLTELGSDYPDKVRSWFFAKGDL